MGSSGYTGLELLRILLKHPYVNIKALIGETSAGKHISEVFSSFQGIELPIIDTFVKTNLKILMYYFHALQAEYYQKTLIRFLKIY